MSDDSDDFNAPVTDGSGTTANVPYTPTPDPPPSPPDDCVTTTVEIFPDPDVPVCVSPGTEPPEKQEDTGDDGEDGEDSGS